MKTGIDNENIVQFLKMDQRPETILLYCGVFLLLLIYWIRQRRKNLVLFQELGIPGPPPHFLFGNIQELNKKGQFQCHEEWIEKYGKVVGFYDGMKPILLVADPHLLKKIFVSDFHLFSDRPDSIPLRVRSFVDKIIPASDIMNSVLPNLRGEKWKEVRAILSPAFSAHRLKQMIPAVRRVTDVAITVLESSSDRDVEVYSVLERLTLDLICAQAFAMDTDTLRTKDDRLLRSAKVIFDMPRDSRLLFVGKCFPEVGWLAMIANLLKMFIRNRGYIPPLEITRVLSVIIQQRREDPALKRPDLLQSLMDATLLPKDGTNGGGNERGKKLTDLEVKSNALVVFLAGYETTSSALAYAIHYLSQYPDLQKQIQNDIDDLLAKEGELDYYNIGNFHRLERFMLETMRFNPPAVNNISRLACRDVEYSNIKIPRGMQIDVPVMYIHNSEHFHENPQKFEPDRFAPGSGSSSVGYWGFGIGPRSCIGTRLVHLTTKIILATLLRHFDVLPPQNHSTEVKTDVKVATMTPVQVFVRLRKRQHAHSKLS